MLFIYLTPCIPLSYQGEGEDFYKRGFASLELSAFRVVDGNS